MVYPMFHNINAKQFRLSDQNSSNHFYRPEIVYIDCPYIKHLFYFLFALPLVIVSCNEDRARAQNAPTEFEKLFKKAEALRYKDPKKALELFQICDSYEGVRGQEVNVKSELAWMYFLLNDFGSALSFFHKASQEPNTTKNLGRIYRGISAIHAKERNLDSAEIYVYKAIELYKDSNYQQGLMEAKTVVGNILMHRGLVDEALTNRNTIIKFI